MECFTDASAEIRRAWRFKETDKNMNPVLLSDQKPFCGRYSDISENGKESALEKNFLWRVQHGLFAVVRRRRILHNQHKNFWEKRILLRDTIPAVGFAAVLMQNPHRNKQILISESVPQGRK